MENSNQDKENKAMPQNPKPTDELQLHIETVTPDTEKDVVPTSTPATEKSEDKEEQDQQPKDEQVVEEENDDAHENEEPADVQQEETDKKSEDGADERDQIETVSP